MQTCDLRNDQQTYDQYYIIQRKDPEDTAQIKVLQKVGSAKSIEENISNKKSGEHEKKIYSQPSEEKIIHETEIVKEDNEEDSKAPKAIQGRVILPVG